MNEPVAEREALWTQFLQRWPLEILANMTLQQYSQAGNTDCFVYWLEAKTEILGSIWGGSSFKFGVYSRKDQSDKVEGSSRRYSSDYAWLAKYGDAAEVAFEQVRANILQVTHAAQRGDLAAVDQVDLGHAYKWKLAFLYQDRQAPCVLPIYLHKFLRAAFGAGAPQRTSALQRALVARGGDESILLLADQLLAEGQTRLKSSERQQDILGHFKAVDKLNARLTAANATQTFCDLALALHEQGLDWWITGAGCVHAGRTEDPKVWQTAVTLRIEVREQEVLVALNGAQTPEAWQPLDEAIVDELLEAAARDIRVQPLSHRQPHWPDDYDKCCERLVVLLTNGAIRNGYIALPRLQALFPVECITDEGQEPGQRFKLSMPNGEALETCVLKKYGRIQARFGALFTAEKLQTGDRAVLSKVADYHYQLRFARQGETLPAPAEFERSTGQEAVMNDLPLNQILFGPPGTGKTYETIDASLAILAPDALCLERAERKARFDEFVAKGQVRVTTFHQSFSYEDFVEGIRAVPAATLGEDAAVGIQYQVEKGVFTQLCEDAQRNKVYEAQIGVRENARVWKISIEEASSTGETRQYCFKHGEARIGWRDVGDIRSANLADPVFKLGSNDQSSLANFGRDIVPGDVLVCLGTRTQISAVGIVTGEYEYSAQVPAGVRSDYVHKLPVRWLATDLKFDITPLNQGVGLTLKAVYPLWRIKWPALQEALHKADMVLAGEDHASAPSIEPYVLVIDEINRGNISRIFGELITLIEESKRAGAPEALSVLLPYSKERFSVPANLYLIGTMNTSDRSLAGLDIALRRRFVFREMPPKPELLNELVVEGINVGQLLRVMNERIEVLLDRDHCLGHAYFMPLKEDPSLERLELIFRNQVLPLLQEYFFEDWQRIQWVLNDHRKAKTDRFVDQSARDMQALFGEGVDVPAHNRSWQINDAAFTQVTAYGGIIAVQAKQTVVVEALEAEDA